MTRRRRARLQLAALVGATAIASTACAIPVKASDFGIPLPVTCKLFILEPSAGLLHFDVIPGVAGLGCDFSIF